MQYFGFDRPSFGIKTYGFGSSEFSPLDLFAWSKQGVWYDPSDMTTLFQDVAGTVPVTKDGDPVALMKDKSGNGNHATQTVSTARPIYKTDGILHWLYFDGVDDCLVALGTKSKFKFLYNGLGGGLAVAVRFTEEDKYQPVLIQTNSSTTEIGFIVVRTDRLAQSEADGYSIGAFRGVHLTQAALATAKSSTMTGNTDFVWRINYENLASSNDLEFYSNAKLIDVATTVNTPSQLDATTDLSIMATANGIGRTKGRFYGAVITQGGVSARVEQYLAAKSGVTL